jgi:serine protease Do
MDTVIRENNKTNKYKVIIPLLIVFALVGGVLFGKMYFGDDESVMNTLQSRQETTQDINDDRQNAITRVVGKVSSAIVGINVEEVQEVRNPFFDDPFFRQFFGESTPREQVVRGLGSGFIISEDGYILTNDHVAGNATKISVTLTTGETVDARLIGKDPVSDVALLKIEKTGLNYLRFANSDNVLIGEWAIALGNPFGLFEINSKPTVTVGVVSATNMKVFSQQNRVYSDMLQTDASINSGNSGGPLLDANGDVIGMNTIIYTGGGYSQGSIGVGFAISINRVKMIMDELKEKGSIDRNFNVGFRIQPIDDRIAEYLKLDKTQGAVVVQIQPGSISDRAGLRVEDVIIKVNDLPVKNDQEVVFAINDMRVGDTLKMTVLRGGDEEEIEMELVRQ